MLPDMPHSQPPHPIPHPERVRTQSDSSSPLKDESRTPSSSWSSPPLRSQNGDRRRRNKNRASSGAPSEPLHNQPLERLPRREWGMRKDQ
ncbi:hypothetical protein F2Q69_00006817 [Brassica cretica]|uniref:Uncharacterized protein n=1 Tax=Brassica cretica TaxID=69181 RepID=A0A8S9P5X1_BRACR|nr:hypothetical protein F2Q69_00006817 [Brassica cretica]